MEHTIRPVSLADIRPVNRIFSETLPVVPRAFRVYTLTRQRAVFAAEQENRVAGFYVAWPHHESSALWLGYIGVSPATQGKGVGAGLLTHFEDLGRATGFSVAKLAVLESNKKVIPFYEHFGYEPKGEARDPHTGENSHHFSKQLSGPRINLQHRGVGGYALKSPREAPIVLTRLALLAGQP